MHLHQWKIIILNDLYDYYIEKHGYEGKAKDFLLSHGCLFKILMPIYLKEKFGVKRTLVSDDDVFILNDLSYMWDEYEEFGIKKENLLKLPSIYFVSLGPLPVIQKLWLSM